jgi:hypothetical protein
LDDGAIVNFYKVDLGIIIYSPSTMPKIPSQVFLYLRKSKNDLILMDVAPAVEGKSGLTFTPVTIPTGQESTYTITKPSGPSEGTPFGLHAVRDKNGTTVGKRFNIHKDIVARSPTNETITVVSIAHPYAVFGWALHPNPVTINTLAPPAPDPALAPPAYPVPSPATAANIHTAAAVTAAVAAAKTKVRKTPLYNQLAPFVAKQMFDLAVLRKEQCPVTMEDFSAGNTAVMPCGHLFMQFAIEESFKKDPYKCPWCRQGGTPTYV